MRRYLMRILTALLIAVALGWFDSMPAAAASRGPLGWSDPVPLALTITAAAPAVAVAGDRVHIFWLDRLGPTASTGDLWHMVLSADGRRLRPPVLLRSGVDTRLAFPDAISWNGGVAVGWMSRGPAGVAAEIGILDVDGDVRAVLRPDPVRREEAGRISLSMSDDGMLHAVWSQFDGEHRQIWYVGIRADLGHGRPVALVEGDAPALLPVPRPSLFWWESAGAAGFRLMTGRVEEGRVTDRKPLSGTISLVAPLPVLPAVADGNRVLLIPTVERAFSTSGQLYAMRLDATEVPPERVLLLEGNRVSDVSLSRDGEPVFAIWSQGVGRRQTSELHGARLLGSAGGFLDAPSRLTYTIPGSLRPAAVIVGGHAAAVWLEVTGFGTFSLSYGTSAAPRRHRFLLGVTELDLFRPAALCAFAALAVISTLPIGLLLTAATLLLGTVLLSVAQMVAAPFGRLDAFLRRPLIRVAALIAMAVVIEVVVRTMIPGKPTPLLLAVPLLCLAPPAMVLLARHLETPLGRGLVSGGLVLLGALIALFPWGARQLSQF